MDLRDLQLNELKVLNECLKIIEKYKLRYYMLGGTFLGAVRHKGFIPWDDDIDIGMPRPDYEKFISVVQNELPENMELRYFKQNEDFENYFIKIIDKNISFTREDRIEKNQKTFLWIDIFPLDGMPNNKLKLQLHKFSLLYSRLMLQYSKFKGGVNIKKKRPFHEKVLIKFGYLFTKIIHLDVKKQLNKLDKKLKKFNYDNSKFVVNFMGAYKFKEMFPKKLYDNSAEYKFENISLVAPSDYDAVLTQMYGEYMKPPKEDQRFSHSVELKN